MPRNLSQLLVFLAQLVFAACTTSPNAGQVDAGAGPDAVTADTGHVPSAKCQAGCTLLGWCTWVPAYQGCIAASDADCRRGMVNCEIEGDCYFDPESRKCFASSKDGCEGTWGCKVAGLCHADGARCKPTTQSDCQQSYRCKKYGDCTLVEGPGDAKGDAECRPGSTADCASAMACLMHGFCTYAPGVARCFPSTTAQCQASAECADYGACALATDVTSDKNWAGTCLKPPSTDCATTKACKAQGDCFNHDDDYACHYKYPLDCSKTEDCLQKGWCKANLRYDSCMADDNPYPYPYTFEMLP